MRALTLRQTSHNAQSGFSILWDGVHHDIALAAEFRWLAKQKRKKKRKKKKKKKEEEEEEEEEDGCGASIGTVKFLPPAKLCGREKQQRRYYIKSINQSMFYFMSVSISQCFISCLFTVT